MRAETILDDIYYRCPDCKKRRHFSVTQTKKKPPIPCGFCKKYKETSSEELVQS